ncbi:Gfo/Idh/MocA family oxidoreductase [Vibrio campbellii]|uniref:Gfo/Idh/MocA family oxidoreductase n=1 Tax=Vibrio campbellii TaxID=680 RepID=UPI001F17CDE0|nr:Gfo/Idh/MocA family oxidoreductase [Vibrio campbellii]
MKVCVVGATGAFGQKHLEALRCIEDVTVTAMVAPEQDKLDQLITDYNQAAQGFASLEEALKSDNIDAVILATPTQKASLELGLITYCGTMLVTLLTCFNTKLVRRHQKFKPYKARFIQS